MQNFMTPKYQKAFLALNFGLGCLYVLDRLLHISLPSSLTIFFMIISCASLMFWLALAYNRRALGVILARSWPLWFGLLWLREWAPAKTYATDLIATALVCSLSLDIGRRLAGRRLGIPLDNPWLPPVLAVIYAFVFWLLPSLKYWNFYSYWNDLGYMLHPLWNTAHGRLFEFMRLPGIIASSLGDHFTLIYLGIAPLYRLLPSAIALFALQSIFVAAAGLILYKWVNDALGNRKLALLFQAALYLWFPLQDACVSDFHTDVLGVPFVFLSLWAYHRRKPVLFWLGLAVALSCKEHLGFALAPLPLLLALQKQWRVSLIIGAALMIAYSFAAHTVFIPFFNFGKESAATIELYPGGEHGMAGMLAYAIKNPLATFRTLFSANNIEQLCWIFVPLVLVPLLAWPQVLCMAPLLLKEMYGVFYMHNHHQAIMAPLLFWCLLTFVKKCSREGQKWIMASVVLSCIIVGFIGGESPISHRFWRTLNYRYMLGTHAFARSDAVKLIPPGVSVSASSNIAVHLCDRRQIYLFPRPFIRGFKKPSWLNRRFATERDQPGQMVSYLSDSAEFNFDSLPAFVVFDSKHIEVGFELRDVIFDFMTEPELARMVERLALTESYKKIYDRDGAIVLKKRGE
ncbi:MAG: DUF2079 domain-containing protein [Chitinivibrionales bacterium]|nr:DUF2079 domain-containing protein [Chitinivibrionales bacterium]